MRRVVEAVIAASVLCGMSILAVGRPHPAAASLGAAPHDPERIAAASGRHPAGLDLRSAP